MKKLAAAVLAGILCAAGLSAQDFGFGFDEEAGPQETAAVSPQAFPVKIGGEIAAELIGYVHDFESFKKASAALLGDMLSGALNFSVSGTNVDAYIGLNLSAASFRNLSSITEEPAATPLILDEAFLRAYFGPVHVEAGYRKLSWGKADSLGPLDIVNPLDYTDLTNIADIQAIKIARPMLHVTWNAGGFSKLEAVFIPNFTGHRFARDGRWAPAQLSRMAALVQQEFATAIGALPSPPSPPGPDLTGILGVVQQNLMNYLGSTPATAGLGYFQTGLRFTTTIGPVDIGAQYYYGNLFQPDLYVRNIGIQGFLTDLVAGNTASPPYYGNTDLLSLPIKYSRYHQIGVDYAQVLWGFNIRAELAFHLTEDINGRDGSARNPFIGWSLGFDRDLVWGINANIQCNETIRLFNSRVSGSPALDCEAGAPVTSTRFTARFSKKFLRDELESQAIIIWDIENMDCYVIPALFWNIRDLTVELSAGIFGGRTSGDLGQYRENSFIKAGVKYSF